MSLLTNPKLVNSKNAHSLLSSMTGVKTDYVESSVKYLAGSVEALKQCKFKIAGSAALCSASAMIIAGTKALTDKEVRNLSKLTEYTTL
jgi:hypothetical protein